MSQFYIGPNIGIGFPAAIRNQSSASPIINLHHNTTTGIGFFTSVGVAENEDADTNASYTDASKYLINLPLLKRSPGYIAVVMSVSDEEAELRDNFTASSNPGVYIYTGTYPAGSGIIPTNEWRDNSNWMQVQGSGNGSGSIDIDIDGADTFNNLNLIDFVSAADRTVISSQSTDGIKIDVASDFAGPSQNFYLGLIGQAFADDADLSTAASGVSIQSTGRIESRSGGSRTVIDGNSINTATIDATGQIHTSGGPVVAGDPNGTHSIMSQAEVRSNTVRTTSLVTSNVVSEATENIQFRVEGIPGAYFKLTKNETDYEPLAITNDGVGNEAFVHFNSRVRFHNIDNLPDEVSYFYAEGSDGRLIKMSSASVLAGGTEISGGFGINVNSSDQISIDTSDVVTVNTNQNITSRKGIGRVTITGDLGSAGNTQKSFVFAPNAISEVASSSFYDNGSSDKLKLLYMVDNDSVEDNGGGGQVYKGVSGSYFLNKYLTFGQSDFVTLHNTDQDRYKISLRDIAIRNDGHDASMYKVRSRRLGAHSFTPAQVSSDLTAHGKTAEQITAVQEEIRDGATIIEWVREAGNYNNPSNGDEALRRNAGVIMKSGFTAESDPYDSAGILASKFRFSAKEAGQNEVTTTDEELGGTLTYGAAADNYYGTAEGASQFAIQIGTKASNSGVNGDRLNEVSIPNLFVKNLAVDATNDGGIYIDSGANTGQFEGNWSFGGNVTISGVLTATNASNDLGGGSVSTLSTTASLLELGAVAEDGDDIAERDIGVIALFNYDGDQTGVPENDEAMATVFFRDSSESGISTIYGRSSADIGNTDNHHRPWKLMTSSEKVDVLTTDVNVADDFHPTGLLLGGLKLEGYDTGLSGGENHLYTGYVNRIINVLPTAIQFEGNQDDDWWGGGTVGGGALVTADAVINYVTNTVGGFGEHEPGELSNDATSVDQFLDFIGANGYTNLFKFGIANDSEVANDDNAYSVGTSWGVIVQQQANTTSTVHKRVQPEEIGLALYEDSTQNVAGQTRPAIGWLPGGAQLNRGTSVRHIMNKMFTAFSFPTISEFDYNGPNAGAGYNTINEFVANNHKILTSTVSGSLILENGYNDYGYAAGTDDDDDYAGSNGVRVKLTDASGIDELTFSTTLTNVSVTKEDATPVTAFTTDLTTHYVDAAAVSSSNLVVSAVNSGDDKIVYMDFAAGANGIGDDAGEVDLTSTQREGSIRYQATINALSDSSYDSELPYSNSSKTITHEVRRRSFMFVSNMNLRASFKLGSGTLGFTGSDLDFAVPVGNYANMDGSTAASDPADGTGYSNRFMHYLLSKAATNDVGSVLGEGDEVQTFGGTNMTFNPSVYGVVGYTGSGTASANPQGELTEIRIRHAVSIGNGDSELTNSERRPHGTNSTDLQRYPGYLATHKGVLGDSQRWLKSTLGTSTDGFLYRAIPKVMAANSLSDSDWVVNGEPKWKVEIPNIPPIDELLLDGSGNLVTFTMTNQYGVETEYVLFQSEQSLEGTPFDGASSVVQEFGKIVLV